MVKAEFWMQKNIFSGDELGGSSVLRKKLDPSCSVIRNPRMLSSKLTVSLKFDVRRIVFEPQQKRAEYIAKLEDQMKRLEKIINSTRTKTALKIRAVEVFAELTRNSYTMVRDEEIERTERETQALEEEAKRPATDDSTEEEKQSTNPA